MALLGVLALSLHGCDHVQVQEGAALGATVGGTLRDVSGLIQSLKFSVDDWQDDPSNTEVSDVQVWNFEVPDVTVSPMGDNDSQFSLQVSNVHADFHAGYLKAVASGQSWEIVSIKGVLQGRFHMVMAMNLTPPYAVDFNNCWAVPEVTVQHLERKTWHTADYFGLGGIVDMKVRQALEEAAEKMFQQQVCGAYQFSKPMQKIVDAALRTEVGPVRNLRTQLDDPYDWHESRILQWMATFNEHAHRNRFSIKGALEPFLEGLSTPAGHCLLGSTADGCSMEVPHEVTDLFTRTFNTTDGNMFNLTVENLEVRLIDFTIPTVELPRLEEYDNQVIGFDLAVAPLNFKVLGDVVVKSNAYNAFCDIRKHASVDLLFNTIGASGTFLVQADAAEYNKLAPDQQASLACADSVITDFTLNEFRPNVSLERIGLYISPDEDHQATEKLVKGLRQIADNLIVTGIRNSREKIDSFLSAKTFEFVSWYVNSKEGIGGLARSLGQDLGECPSKQSFMQALGWALAAALAFAAAAALLALGQWDPKIVARASARLLHPDSLAALQHTPTYWRLCVPTFAVGCILLYIESNTGVAAVMTVFLTSEGSQDVEVLRLTEFGVVKSVWDLWNAGMKGLALLLFSFSVIFPYLKLTFCLVCWLLPMREDIRGRILWVLNALAKWSLLDAFVLMTLMGLGALEGRMHGGISVSVYIDPRPSFVSFLVATIFSFALGELILHCHEVNQVNHEESVSECSKSRECSLIAPMGMLIVSLLLLVFSSGSPVCAYEIQGIVGWFLNFLNDDPDGNKSSFSLISLGTKLWGVTSDMHRWEATMMQLIYFLSAFVMNSAFVLGAIAYSVIRPGGVAMRIRSFLPVMFACCAADVFAFGTILTVIETREGSFVPTPGWLREQVEQNIRPRIQMPGASNEIIQIVPRVESGAWVIALGSVLFAIGGHQFLNCGGTLPEGGQQRLLSDVETASDVYIARKFVKGDYSVTDHSDGTGSDEY